VNDARTLGGAARLLGLLHDANATQWERPPAEHRARNGGRVPGSVSDPTAETALDDTRLQLRAAVDRVAGEAGRLADELEAALERFRSLNVDEESLQRNTEFPGQDD